MIFSGENLNLYSLSYPTEQDWHSATGRSILLFLGRTSVLMVSTAGKVLHITSHSSHNDSG